MWHLEERRMIKQCEQLPTQRAREEGKTGVGWGMLDYPVRGLLPFLSYFSDNISLIKENLHFSESFNAVAR